jgi:predicted glycosyltransferase
MKLLFVVGHPAHVHFFRHTIEEMRSGGHEVLIGVVAKETTLELLALYGYDYDVLGGNVPNLLGKVLDLPAKDFRFFRFLSRKRPDLVLSVSSPYAAHACAALSVPHIAFSDTEIAKAILSLTYPFTDAFLTPASFAGNLGARHIRYNGYKELAYLHPNWFKPNSEVLDLIGAGADETLILVRFASWDSSHDFGTRSLRVQPAQRMITIVNELKKYGRILLTSECPLPPELQEYTIHIPLHRIHDLLSYASLYLGEGATMAAEAGVLGTPWIFVSPSGRGYLQEQQQRYGLGFWERSDRDAIDRAVGILSRRNLRAEWKSKQQTLLADKIDVTRYIIEFVEGWPRSFDEEMARAHVVREAPQPQPARG